MTEKTCRPLQVGDVVCCPRCKGKGAKFDPADVWLAPVTFGLSLISGRRRCRHCGGKGFIRV